MSSNIFRLADRLFNQPLLATESLAHSAATYVNNRLLGDVQAAVNFDKPKGDARSLLKVKDDIAIIPIMGGLTHRMTFIDAMCTGGLSSYEGLRRGFDEALADESIKTIVLHIDSGGGEASGCFELARHIMASRGQKKIIAYVDEFACSAAYALASSAEEIIASPDADVGSIGVIMVHQELTKAFEKNGVTINVIKAGEFKGMGSPFQTLSEESKERLQKRINDTYATFTGFVAESRNLSEEAVKNTEANVYSAQEALELGLINSIMSQDDFLNYLQGSEEAPVSLNVNNSGEEMTEQEKQELEALRLQVAQMKAKEQEAALSDLTNKISASAEAFGFDAKEAATTILGAGLDNPLSVLFMNAMEGANQKLNETIASHASAMEEKESEITKLKETAGAVLEHSNAMEEVGNDGEADLVEEEKEPAKNASEDTAEQRKLALQNALKSLIK